MKPTLMVLAAGMGSRYGGLKQLDGVGPNGETIMDYSIYDAHQAGFGKVVFVIRRLFEKEFKDIVLSKYLNMIPAELVFQELDDLPKGYKLDPKREKPWGTNHAVMMGENVINEPFAVINADDFYGRESFKVLANKLKEIGEQKGHYCMVGYRLNNTLSDSGYVSRGICETDAKQYLKTVTERTHIERKGNDIQYQEDDNSWHTLEEKTHVSMNMWGFTPDYFKYSNDYFKKFLDKNKDNLKAEYFIPYIVDELIKSNNVDVKVLDTPEKWFGVTYAEDRPSVVSKLQLLTEEGIYPTPLWK